MQTTTLAIYVGQSIGVTITADKGGPDMLSKHEFTLILARPEESEEDADRLYEAGCSDGSISTSSGITRIDFHREAATLEDAIRSAVANVNRAGFAVARIEIDSPQYCS